MQLNTLNTESHEAAFKRLKQDVETSIKQMKAIFKDKTPIQYMRTESTSLFASRSMSEFMNHDLSLPFFCCLIIGIYCSTVITLCWFFAGGHTILTPSVSYTTSTITSRPVYDMDFDHDVQDTLSKLVTYHLSGNKNAFENLLHPAMQDYCFKQLGHKYLDHGADDSFHLNIAESIAFVAERVKNIHIFYHWITLILHGVQGKFTAHSSMAVTPDGGIVDPFNLDSNPRGSESCPLVDALFQRGTQNEGYQGDVTKEEDSGCRFDRQFDFRYLNNFLDVATEFLSTQDGTADSKCSMILRTFNRETVRRLLLKWAELVEEIVKETEEQYPKGSANQDEWETFVPDPESNEYKKYMIGFDGGIHQTHNYEDADHGFLWCDKIEYFLNTKFILVDGYTYTAIRIGIEDTFDQWYEDTLDAMQINEVF